MEVKEEPTSPTAASDTKAEVATENANGGSASQNAKLRKRTKTGCLTCRRRRIKCGEERPVCGNCMKSKRNCEGYVQRIVFKTMEGWPGLVGPSTPLQFHTANVPGAPRPTGYSNQMFVQRPAHYGIPLDQYGRPIPLPTSGGSEWSTPQYPLPQYNLGYPLPHSSMQHSGIPLTPPAGVALQNQHYSVPLASPGQTSVQYQSSPNYPPETIQAPPELPLQHVPPPHADLSGNQSIPTPPTTSYAEGPDGFYTHASHNGATEYFGSSIPYQSVDENIRNRIGEDPSQVPNGRVSIDFSQRPGISRQFTGAPLSLQPVTLTQIANVPVIAAPLDLNEAATEWQFDEFDEDLESWHSDEDAEYTPDEALIQIHENQQSLQAIVNLHREHTGETGVRDYNTFIYSGFLTNYEAEKFASPLKNPHTARVFAHFLSATAPSISIFERLPHSTSPLFSGNNAPSTNQGLWTFILPVMALNHQGLLHAMLSLSSYHIAKLQNDSTMPAYKHYTYAIKRINQCVGHVEKRHRPTTIAATLLLGFYEVMTADHNKWCSHLSGASRLLQEIDYRSMSRLAKRYQAEQMAQENALNTPYLTSGPSLQMNDPSLVDDGLIDRLVGRTREEAPSLSSPQHFDLPKYQLYQDLFWWYARQDTYQSVLAGNRLLLNYYRWSDCPPRAAVGRVDAVYGTHDHLFLIWARIADFSAKDRVRKLKVMDTTGGIWRPPAGMNMPSRPGPPANQGPPTNPNIPLTPGMPQSGGPRPGGFPPPPSFYGMAPMPTNISMPSSYSANMTTPPYQSPTSSEAPDLDLDGQTMAAISEWNQMYKALNELGNRFGPGFKPLDPDLHSHTTPFGPPIVHTSYDISVIWCLYYAAHIVALRSHPNMPPFAHMAAGVAAGQTVEYGQTIGRIAAGMMPGPIRNPINPSVGTTFCEAAMGLFIAGVQYTDPAQREWLVSRTREVEGLTGWSSMGMIAQGCETAWEKAGQIGMGPPYIRTRNRFHLSPSPAHAAAPRRTPEEDEIMARAGGSLGHWGPTRQEDPRGMRVHLAMGLLSGTEDVEAEKAASRIESGSGGQVSYDRMPPQNYQESTPPF